MTQEQMMFYFQNNFSEIKETILNVTVFADETPSKTVCTEIAAGLLNLAEKKGDKNAAALYCLVAAFGNHAGAFSEDTACRLVFDLNAVEAYHELVDDELLGILDNDPYQYMYAFPVTYGFKKLNNDGDSK